MQRAAAYEVARLTRAKELPDFKTYIDGPQKRFVDDPEEQKISMRAWAKRRGAKVK